MPVLASLLLAFAAVQDKDAGAAFSSAEGNYKFTVPKGWVRMKNPAEIYQISMIKSGNFLGVSGLETESTVEALLSSIEEGQKQQGESYRSLGRASIKVAGERAVQLRAMTKREGSSLTLVATAFTHEGGPYRLIA